MDAVEDAEFGCGPPEDDGRRFGIGRSLCWPWGFAMRPRSRGGGGEFMAWLAISLRVPLRFFGPGFNGLAANFAVLIRRPVSFVQDLVPLPRFAIDFT